MNSLVADIVAVVCLEVENRITLLRVVYARSRRWMSSECRVVSRKADGGGSRGRVEETRCSELRRLSGRDARRVRIRLRGRTQARPLANKSRRADWRCHQPAFACCLWQLFPAAGGGLGRCLSEGQVFRSRGLIVRYTINSHVALERCNCSCGLQRC